jgi:hypothetical protein
MLLSNDCVTKLYGSLTFQQVQIEQTASQVYLAAAAYFARDSAALPVSMAQSDNTNPS